MGGKTVSTSSPKINQLSIQSSSLGVPVTRGWGTGRTKCNLLWYGAFRAIAHTTKQKGKGAPTFSNTTYTYTASMILGVATGPIRDIRSVYRDKEVFVSDEYFSALSRAGLSLATGTATQAPWGYLTSLFPDQALGYSRTAYVYASDYPLTDSATLRNHSFEVQFSTHVAGLDDANPRDILTEFLTDPVHGVKGWTTDMIADLSNWSDYCLANDLLLSLVLDQQRPASEVLGELGQATNSEIFWSEGKLKVVPYGDTAATGNGVTWTPNLTPIYDLTEDDFDTNVGEAPVSVEIVDQSDAYNIIQVEFLDRANQYNTGIQPAPDLDNILIYGERKKDPVSLHSICRASVASTVAQLMLARTLYRREKYKFRLPWNFVLLEPMDYVTLTTTTDELRLNRVLVQIESIDEDDEDGVLEIVAEGVSSGSAAAASYNSHSGSGYSQNTAQSPGSVSNPVLINAPISLTGGEPQVWCAVGSTSQTWGGCEVWISADDTQYRLAGTINGGSRYGALTSTLASHADPDPSGSFGVDLVPADATLLSGSALDLSVAATLCSVGSELVAYQDATLTSPTNYTLSGLRRGLYGTTPQTHLSGAPFVRLDDSLFKFSYGDMAVGTTLFVKFASFNLWGHALQDIADLTPYTIDLLPQFTTSTGALASFTLIPTAGMYISGQRVRKVSDTDTWAESVRSAESYRGGAAVYFRPSQTNLTLIVGLNSDPTTNNSYDTIDYGILLEVDGTVNAIEAGSVVSLGGAAYSTGDTLGVVYDGSTVKYTRNGTVLRSISASANMNLYLDSSFRSPGAEVQSITFTSIGRVGVDGAPGAPGADGTTLYTWIAYADSPDGSLNFTTGAPGGRNYIGIAANRTSATESTTPSDYTWAQYAGPPAFGLVAGANCVVSGAKIFKTANGGAWNSQVYSSESFLGGASLSFRVETTTAYMVGLNTDPTTNASYNSIDYAVYVSGTTVEIWNNGTRPYGPVASFAAVGDVFGIQYDGKNVRYTKNGTEFFSQSASAGQRLWLDSSFVDVVGGPQVTILSFAAAGAAGTDGAPGSPGADGTTLYTWIAYADSPDGSLNFTTGAPGNRTFIGIAANRTSATESTSAADYTWSQYSGPPSFGLVGSSDMTISGSKIYRSAGGDWNAQVYSSESFLGGAVTSFRVEAADTDFFLGLNTDPTTNASYNSIDYAIRCYDSQYEVWNNGSPVFGPASHSVGDVFGIQYNGSVVSYTRNGTQFFSQTPSAGLRLWLDSSFSRARSYVQATILSWSAAGPAGTNGTNAKTLTVSRSSVILAATWQGVVKSGQLPTGFKATIKDGTADVSSSASWSVASLVASASVGSDGTVTISSVSSDTTLTVTATYSGTNYTVVVPITLTNDPAPPQGSTSVYNGTVSIDNTTSQPSNPTTDTVLLKTSDTGQLVGSGSSEYYVAYGQNNSSRTFTARAILYYRVAGGTTWTAFSGGAVDGSIAIAVNNIDFETSSSPGSVAINQTQTGLSPNTTYEIGMALWRASGSAASALTSVTGGLSVSLT